MNDVQKIMVSRSFLPVPRRDRIELATVRHELAPATQPSNARPRIGILPTTVIISWTTKRHATSAANTATRSPALTSSNDATSATTRGSPRENEPGTREPIIHSLFFSLITSFYHHIQNFILGGKFTVLYIKLYMVGKHVIKR